MTGRAEMASSNIPQAKAEARAIQTNAYHMETRHEPTDSIRDAAIR